MNYSKAYAERQPMVPYRAHAFGNPATYAGRGLCSRCGENAATHMNRKATYAICDECMKRGKK